MKNKINSILNKIPITLKTSQKKILNFLLLKKLENQLRSTCIVASVRSGKTLATLLFIDQFKDEYKNILWLANSVDERNFELIDEIKKWNLDYLIKRITIIHPASLKSYSDKINVNYYDIIVYNECHNITETRMQYLRKYKRTIIGLTGTYPNKYNKKLLLKKINLLPDFEYLTEEAVGDQSISNYKISIFEVPLSTTLQCGKSNEHQYINGLTKLLNTKKAKYKKYIDKYEETQKQINTFKNYHDENPSNKKKLRDLYNMSSLTYPYVKKYNSDTKFIRIKLYTTLNSLESKNILAFKLLNHLRDKRYLVFANNTEQSNRITKYTYNSKTGKENLSLFHNEKIPHLCLINKGGTGTTFKNLDGCLLLNINSSNMDMLQKIGRTLLFKENNKSNIIILISKNTIQKNWILKALEDLPNKKIDIYESKNINEIIKRI